MGPVGANRMRSRLKLRFTSSLCALLLLCSFSTIASEKVTGTFQAARSCDAYQSFKAGTNPGPVKLSPGAQYDAVEVNKLQWDWIRVEVPEVNEPLRWVSKECGIANVSFDTDAEQQCNIKNQHDSYVLAVTWQPGFCEHYSYSREKPECNAMQTEELVVNHLTLHGLWPNRDQCGTNYGRCAGPKLDLDESTIATLAPWMPNLIYEQDLASHEWDKHGTCQDLSDDDYFLTARKLVALVDESEIGSYIKPRIGQNMSVQRFFEHITATLDQDVADRVMLVCANGQYLQEIRINLPFNFIADGDLSRLVSGADQFKSRTQGCSGSDIYIERSGPS